MKTVLLLLNSDRFSFPLIRYLTTEGKRHGWKTCVGSIFDCSLSDSLKQQKFAGDINFIHIADMKQCDQAIRKSELVIGLMPDALLLQIADRCIALGKSLIAPSRLTRQMALKKAQAEENNVLLLMECGFSPGLDHVTAKMAVDNISAKGGKIVSFKTYSGSLIAEDCIDHENNPLGLKLTEPTAELINVGKQNNRHLIQGQLQHIPYHQLFNRTQPVSIVGMNNIIAVPEGDSLYYKKIYQLNDVATVMKGKLFRKGFERIWNLLIKLGLTDNTCRIDLAENRSFYAFLNSMLPYAESESVELKLMNYAAADILDLKKLKWLGFFDDDQHIGHHKELTAAIILQYLLEKKCTPQPEDKDCIIMQHQLEYNFKLEQHKFTATLVTEGENQQESAIAKAIALITGGAAKAFMCGLIASKGLHIPTKKEIYDPILNDLEEHGFAFHVEDKKIYEGESDTILSGKVA